MYNNVKNTPSAKTKHSNLRVEKIGEKDGLQLLDVCGQQRKFCYYTEERLQGIWHER